MSGFKEWELKAKATMVSTGNIDTMYLYEIVRQVLQDHAGRCGYLIGSFELSLERALDEEEK